MDEMNRGQVDGGDVIGPDLDAEDNNEVRADAATDVAAKIFGDVPLRVPFWKAAAIEAQAAFAERLPGSEMTIGNGPGPVIGQTREEAREEVSKRNLDQLLDVVEFTTEQRKQDRKRQEWATATHSLAGQTLTGTEWGEIADALQSDSAGRRWLLDYLMQKGQTQAEAEQAVSDMQLAASAMSKPESDRTAEEQAAMNRIDANPENAEAFERYREAQEKGFPPAAASNTQLTSSGQMTSTAARADALSDSFPTAPGLSEHHRLALSASQPLEARPTVQVAQPPAPAANAGLEI